MFIFVAYKDAPELSTTFPRSSSETELSTEKTLLVNPNCPVRVMLEYIRKKCRLGSFTNFDLSDECGYMKGLFSMNTYANAMGLFEHKRTYYLIVVKQGSDRRISVLPQLNHDNHKYLNLKDRCRRFLANGSLSPQALSPLKTTPPQSKAPSKKK